MFKQLLALRELRKVNEKIKELEEAPYPSIYEFCKGSLFDISFEYVCQGRCSPEAFLDRIGKTKDWSVFKDLSDFFLVLYNIRAQNEDYKKDLEYLKDRKAELLRELKIG